MTLATVDESGQPTARIVLLRGFDERGFTFFTNSRSVKGRQIEANRRVALCFHWDELGEQVRVEGTAERVDDTEADEYWKTRPRESQLGAWASDQSATLTDPSVLEERVIEYESRFANKDVPRPPHWTGFRVVPHRLEFWTRRPARLHERIAYELQNGTWTKRLLFP